MHLQYTIALILNGQRVIEWHSSLLMVQVKKLFLYCTICNSMYIIITPDLQMQMFPDFFMQGTHPVCA